MTTHSLFLLPGDGIGPEVMAQVETIIAWMNEAGIACGRLSTMDDLIAHPQRRITAVQTETGEVEMLAPGARVKGIGESFGRVPRLGEHSSAVRKEFAP